MLEPSDQQSVQLDWEHHCAKTADGQPLHQETMRGHCAPMETEPASMIRACSCLALLAGHQRTTVSLRYSDEGPGAGGAGAASRSAMLQCRAFRCRKRQRNRFYTAMVSCTWTLQNFLSKILAAASCHSPPPEPICAASVTHCCPSHSQLQRQPSITCSGKPHSPRPKSLAAALRHSPLPVVPSLSTAHTGSQSHSRDWVNDWLSDSVTQWPAAASPSQWRSSANKSWSLCHRSDLEHPDRHIWSTLIAILGIFVNKFIHEFIFSVTVFTLDSCANSYLNSCMNS